MSINKWVVRISDGQFCLLDGPDPAIYLKDKVNYALVDLGDDGDIPDPRIHKWDGRAVVNKSQEDIAIYDRNQNDMRIASMLSDPFILSIVKILLDEFQKYPISQGQTPIDLNGFKDRFVTIANDTIAITKIEI